MTVLAGDEQRCGGRDGCQDWNGGVPYSMVIAPGGKVHYRGSGRLDILKTRRLILGSFPDDDYAGQNAYWKSK